MSEAKPPIESTITPQPASQPDRLAQPVDAEQPPRLAFPVVGIGASAGGIEAFNEFFEAMRPDSGMAFVLILHLPPERESMMSDILSKHTAMRVAQVTDGQKVEPNHVYVIRPGHTLTIHDGLLHLGEPLEKPGHRRPVDDFFRSLAEEQRERAICIVLSGMGSNGSAGAQAVKAVGGVCIAQEPESAKFPDMPQNLIEAGLADFILRPREMPEILVRYAAHPYARGVHPADLPHRERQFLNEILAILRSRTRQDFGGYKKPTVIRRIQRRMGLAQITTVADYVRVLRQSPIEVSALVDDLRIHVTGFFRDNDAWETLYKRAVVPLIAEHEPDSVIRAWVTACSSGEEAYTLAIVLVEAADAAGKHLDIKVFATDIADRSLAQARSGIYPAGIESEISPQRLERFFDKDDATYRVKKELRELVIFAPQNVLQDPPFSRLDICTCRNLLIYLEPDVQRRVLSLLHFGLREGGVLFLGTSEAISGAEELFDVVDKKSRIFRRVGPTRHGSFDFAVPRLLPGDADIPYVSLRPPRQTTLGQLAQSALLEQFTPPAVVVDRQNRIVFFHGRTAPYLDQPRGEPTRDVFTLVAEEVRGAVRMALHKAMAQNESVTVRNGLVTTPQGRQRIEVTASPLEKTPVPNWFLVSFKEVAEPAATSAGAGEGRAEDRPHLERELQRVRNELQLTIDELQSSNEEMKASNEEVTSVNEELQSTNEEMETSREELQSLNEELSTVNAQLHAKMEELEGTTNDLSSLLSSTDIAVVFLDTQLRIRRYTPAVNDLFELIPSDAGRPLSDLAHKFTDPHLHQDALSVLARLVPVEREITSESRRVYMRRVLPYRTTDNRIEGVVITFVDVTPIKRAEEEMRRTEERYRLIVEGVKEYAIFMLDVSGRISTWNAEAQRMLGYSEKEAVGEMVTFIHVPEDRAAGEPERTMQAAHEKGSTSTDRWYLRKDGCRFWGSGIVSALNDEKGKLRGFVKVLRDNTDRKRAEEKLQQAKIAAEAANAAKDQFLANVSHELRTPLSAILMWAKLLCSSPHDVEQSSEGLEAIERSAEGLKCLVDDLLDSSRIAAGKLRIEMRECDLGPAIETAIETIQPAALEKGVKIHADLRSDVGVVRADANRIRQVVVILLSNAVKFTPAGGTVHVSLGRRNAEVEIRVTDTGQGITPEFLPQVFLPFRQEDGTSSRSHGGLGLGLAIARQLVELHGGTITAASEGRNKGATFSVKLALPTLQDRTAIVGTSDSVARLDGVQILLVDDDADMRNAFTAVLREAGAKVTVADSAPAALDAFARNRPDVIVSDIAMPEMDGYELIRRIRAVDVKSPAAPVPAIAMTAFGRDDDRERAVAEGFKAHLTKPVPAEKLVSVIRSLTGKSG